MTTPTAAPLPVRRLAAFAMLGVATGGFNIPLQAYLPAFYAQTMGLGLETVGTIFLFSRLWSAFSDPVVGWLSDHTHTRLGRRKPWILGGGLLFLIAAIAVFLPPPGAGDAWLAIGLLLLCLGWTATATPHYAWGGELSADPRQRARIQSYIQTGASVGVFAVLLMPAALEFLHVGDAKLHVQAMGLFVVAALAPGLLLIAALFREAPGRRTEAAAPAKGGLGAVLRDRLLWRIIASDFFVSLGQGARGAVFVFFVTFYMQLHIAAILLLIQYSFGIVAAPLWARISYRLGRPHTLILAELVQVAINLAMLLLTPGRAWLLVALVMAQGLTQGSGNLMLRAMIYDVADRHRATTGIERAGLFSSVFNVTTNAAMALAVAIAFFVIGWFGFRPAGPNDATALTGLLSFFAVAPALGHGLSALLILRFPADRPQTMARTR
ncbi:MFS transporter [Flavisphingomonas formosensis]|uniref:MFS transporter n=1 Tax=Flavisphingomonas formosensis TaxID=861534 RepID=UPI0012FC062E|nr:MFS transporter [Sphingomonas formosensis]